MPRQLSQANRPSVGQICWFEVPVTDAKRAAVFYAAVLDWQTNPDDEGRETSIIPGVSKMHMFQKDSFHGAFLVVPEVANVLDDKAPGKIAPLATFLVKSIEETLETVVKNGGRVHL